MTISKSPQDMGRWWRRAQRKGKMLSVLRLAKVSDLAFGEPTERVGGHAVLSDGTAVFVPLGDAIDVERECTRLGTEVERLLRLVEGQEKKLSNEQFTSRAPADVVERERQKLAAWEEQRTVLVEKRARLGCAGVGSGGSRTGGR